MAANGSGVIGSNSKVTVGLLLTILLALFGAVGGYYSGQANAQVAVAAHVCNMDLHHSTADLNKAYANKESVADIKLQLNRIETKLDRHMESEERDR